MANNRERRKWALEMSAALLDSDMDNFDPAEFDDEDEKERRVAAVRKIAKEKAARMRDSNDQTK